MESSISAAGKLDVTEFAFDAVNEVIYEEKGVTIRSIPAVHGLDGAVSFILEWKGLKFAYSSDTIPNKWWAEHTKGADIAIHECFLPVGACWSRSRALRHSKR